MPYLKQNYSKYLTLLLFPICFYGNPVAAQQPNWSKISNDTAQIDSMLSYTSTLYKEGKAEQGIEIMYSGIKIAQKLKDNWRLANLYLALGEDYNFIQNRDSAISYLSKAETLGLQYDYTDVFPFAQADMLTLYSKKLNKGESQILINRMLSNSYKIKDNSTLGTLYNNIGSSYGNIGYKELALSYFIKGLQYLMKTKDSITIATASLNIGQIQNSLKYYNKAIHSYDIASNYLPQKKSVNVMVVDGIIQLVNGLTYEDMQQLNTAEKYYYKAIDILKNGENPYALCEAYSGAGRVAVFKKKFSTSGFLLHESLVLAKKTGIKSAEAKALNSFGILYKEKKDYEQAENYFLESLQVAIDIEDQETQKELYKHLAEINEEKANYQKAFMFQKEFIAITDSLNNVSNTNKLQEMELRYQTEKKESEIALLQKQNAIKDLSISNKNRAVILLVIGVGLITALAFLIIYRIRLKRLQKETAIRNRIAADLHDEIGSTLSSISLLTEMATNQLSEDNKSTILLKKMNGDARRMMENMDDIVWSINPQNDEFKNLETRIKEYALPLMSGKNIDFDVLFEDSIEDVKLTMVQRRELYLIVKEALNNLVKYSQANKASLKFAKQDNHIIIQIKDNGAGFDTEKARASSRNGLKSMQKRSEALKGKWNIESKPGEGTMVTIIV